MAAVLHKTNGINGNGILTNPNPITDPNSPSTVYLSAYLHDRSVNCRALGLLYSRCNLQNGRGTDHGHLVIASGRVAAPMAAG